MTDAWVRNPADETRIRYRDDGGPGLPVLVLGGFLDPIEIVARTPVVAALPRDALRLIWVDHRGHGASDTPHEPEAYAIDLRVGDVVAVLDDLGIERAGIMGISWGGRLGFGVADRAPQRVRSLVSIGQHPYELRANGPLGRVLAAAMDATATEGISAIVEAFEGLAGRYPEEVRAAYLAEDPVAMRAAWMAALAEGPVAHDLVSWRIPCCVCVAEGDEDFAADARRAAAEIPGARFVVIERTDHLGVDTVDAGPFLNAVVDTLLAEPPPSTGQGRISERSARRGIPMDRSSWLGERRAAVEAGYTVDGPTYDDGYDPRTPTHVGFVEALVERTPPGGWVLDAACGTAPYAGIVLDAGRRYRGVDQSSGMLARAREKWPGQRFDQIGLQEIAIDGGCHAAMCIDAMEHVPPEEWPPVLANLSRALLPGGSLYLTVEEIDRADVEDLNADARSDSFPVVEGEVIVRSTGGYHFYPDRERVEHWLADAGFAIVDQADEALEGYGYHHLLVRR